MTDTTKVDLEKVNRQRDGDPAAAGEDIILHLDLSGADYVAFGERGTMVMALSRELSLALLSRLLEAEKDGAAVELRDDAADAIAFLVDVGRDRQAFMRPLLEGLFTAWGRIPPLGEDPMRGYAAFSKAMDL